MTNQTFSNGYALLVGIGADLPVTVKDASALYNLLIDPGRAAYSTQQVALRTETSATRQQIFAAFDQLIERVSQNPEATVIVYYSGHGGRIEGLDGSPEYFLVPYGFDWSRIADTAISGREFTEKIEAIKARKLVVLLDCCHAGGVPALKEAGKTFTKSPVPPDLLNVLSSGSGRVVVASSREDEYSYTGNPYSAFTTCLLEALQGRATVNKDGYARILDILIYLFDQVPKRTPGSQHPFVNKVLDLGDNFPLCYYAGGSKFLPGESPSPNSTPAPTSLTSGQRRRMELYSFEGVVKALDSAPLVEALHELEGFAKSQSYEELARWASAEINGYSKRDIRVPEELPSYRKSFQITLTEGIRDIEDDISKLQSIRPLHIPNSNIDQLKTRLVQKMAPSLACDPFKRLNISKRLENLLQDIRSHAKRRVDALRLIDDINLHPRQAERDFDTRVTFVQQELQQEREESMNRSSELKFEKEIFISYAWGEEGEEREDYVNHLDRTLQTKGIKIVRDKRALPYKGLIKAFMERIGRGKCVIAVISDKYLKSSNCMFELVQVAKNGKFHDRIFPIILGDAKIYDQIQRLKYIKHWENKRKELNEAIKEVGAEFLQGIREEIDQYTDIRNMIAEITNLLKDMNTLTPDIHSQSEFQVLIESIECRLNEDRGITINGSSSPTTQSLDETILRILYDYYLTHKGNPKMRIDELISASNTTEDEIFYYLRKFHEDAWVELKLTEQGDMGLVWLKSEAIKIVKAKLG